MAERSKWEEMERTLSVECGWIMKSEEVVHEVVVLDFAGVIDHVKHLKCGRCFRN